MSMNRYIFIFLFIVSNFLFVSKSALADPLKTFIAPSFGGVYYNETRDTSPTTEALVSGLRYHLAVDFAALHQHVSITTFINFGTYIDVGGQFRVFDHSLSQTRGGSGFIYGAGLGVSYSPGISGQGNFIDSSAILFLRLLMDTDNEWGFFLETTYEAAFMRKLKESDTPFRGIDHRFYFSVGIPFNTSL